MLRCRICNREYNKKSKFCSSKCYGIAIKNGIIISGFAKGYTPWNYGLTKYTSPLIAEISLRNPGMKGKHQSDYQKMRTSQSHLGMRHPEETKKKMAHSKNDLQWYTNVVNSIKNSDSHQRAMKAWQTKRINGTDRAWNKDMRGGICSEIAVKSWLTKKINGTDLIIGKPISKAGFRKDLGKYFRSSWEANFARILNFLNINWEYEKKRFKLDNNSYCPDFYLSDYNLYIEIRGYYPHARSDKIQQFLELYPSLRLEVFREEEYEVLSQEFSNIVPNWEFYGEVSTSQKEVALEEHATR